MSNPQQQLTDAMMYLYSRCDGAASIDEQGFNGGDARSAQKGFLADMRKMTEQGKNLSYGQLTALLNCLKKYEDTQLKPGGFTLPDFAAIKAHVESTGKAVVQDANVMHVDGAFIHVHTMYKLKDRMGELRTDFYNKVSERGKVYCGNFNRGSAEAKAAWDRDYKVAGIAGFWRFPATPTTLKLIFEYFDPDKTLNLTPEAQKYRNAIVEAELNAKLTKALADKTKQREIDELLSVIGGIDFQFGAGKTLFPHQKIGVNFALERRRCVIGDDRGLGKTLEGLVPALALQKKYDWNVYIITTLSSIDGWHEIAEELGVRHEIFSWDYRKIPQADNERPREKFILIVDEAHNMASIESKRTRAILELAWHWNCEAAFLLTGTPMPNGRPINMYSLLLAVRSELVYPADYQVRNYPIVWDSRKDDGEGTKLPAVFFKMRRKYELGYCDAHYKQIGRVKQVWDVTGATNLREFYLKTQYRPGEENFSSVCCISRRKTDCVNLPPKMRIMTPVEVSDDAQKTFEQTIVQKWEEFQQYITDEVEKAKAKVKEAEEREADEKEIEKLKAEAATKRSDIMNAEALVRYNIFRQAGAWAKIETALVQALEILDRDNKLVIFTSFTDIAKTLGQRIEEASGKKVGYILGEIKAEDRFAAMRDFQNPNGTLQVIISTRAGGEAITLTESQYMLIIDRPLTPGMVAQWEDRIHRLTTTGTVTIYWLQLPSSLCEIDYTIDGVIQQKQINIDAAQFGEETTGLAFATEKQIGRQALDIIANTAKRFQKTFGRKKAA